MALDFQVPEVVCRLIAADEQSPEWLRAKCRSLKPKWSHLEIRFRPRRRHGRPIGYHGPRVWEFYWALDRVLKSDHPELTKRLRAAIADRQKRIRSHLGDPSIIDMLAQLDGGTDG